MEIRELDDAQLNTKIAETKEKVDSMKFDIKAGVLADVAEYRTSKKELAKMMTIRRERQLGIKVVIKKEAVAKKAVKAVETKKEDKKEVKKTKKVTKKTTKVKAK